MRLTITILIALVTIISCKNTNDRDVVIKYYQGGINAGTDSSILELRRESNEAYYTYTIKTKTSLGVFAQVKYQKENGDLYYNEIKCDLEDKKSIKVAGKKYILKRYYFDIESSIDEEFDLFFIEDYGLLFTYNSSSDAYKIYEKDTIFNNVIREELYELRKMPPPQAGASL